MRLKKRHREAVREMELLSGNVETVFDLKVLLDDLILEKDEAEERRQVEQNEQTDREKQLTAAEATIRQLAISRNSRSTDVDDVTEDDTPRKNTKRSSMSVLEDVSTCMVESVERQKASEVKKMELEEKRFLFEKESAEKEGKRFERTEVIAERKKDLVERRFEMEAKYREERSRDEQEEREKAREERRAMLELRLSLIRSDRSSSSRPM